MKRFLFVLATVAMTMLFNPVQAETEQNWKTDGMPSSLDDNVVLTGGPADIETQNTTFTLDGKGHTVYGGPSDGKGGHTPTYGAIWLYTKNSTLILKNVTFDSCGTYEWGGYYQPPITESWENGKGTNKIQLSGSITFSNNGVSGSNVSKYAGVIYTNGKITTDGLTSLTCTGNSAQYGPSVFAAYGEGGIDISNVTGKVEFTNNSSTITTGVIFGTTVSFKNNTNVTFSGNKGGVCGGTTVSFKNNTNVTFSGNTSITEFDVGGTIDAGGDVSFENNTTVTFSGNTVNSKPNDIWAWGSNVIIKGGNYSFDGGIITDGSKYDMGIGNIEISRYNKGQTDEKATTVTFDCDLTADTVSITDSTVTFGKVSKVTSALNPTSQAEATALASPAIMAASTVLSDPTSDLEIPVDLKSTNTQINNTALTLSAGSTTNTVNGNLTISGNSTVTAQDLVVTGKLTNGSGSTLTYTSLNVGSLEIGSGQTMSNENLTISNTGDLTMASGSVLNMSFLDMITVDTATLAGTINIGGNGSEGDYTLLTAGTSLDSDVLSVLYTGSGNYDFSWKQDGNSLLYTLKSKGGPDPGTGVPEPSTWALLILGFAGLMWYRRKK